MTDYHPLIARAVSALDKNTGEARRGLYERARNALVAQLRGLEPPLSESEITRERLSLEEAIRKVEAESARRLRVEPQRPEPVAAVKANDVAPAPESVQMATPDPPGAAHAPPPVTDRTAPRDQRMNGAAQTTADLGPSAARPRARQERPEASDPGLRGFHDVVVEAETLGEATAQAAKSAREAYAAVPTNTPESEDDEPLRGPRLGGRSAKAASLDLDGDDPFPSIVDSRNAPRQLSTHLETLDQETEPSESRFPKGLVWAGVAVSAFLVVFGGLYLARDRIAGLVSRTPAGAQSQQDTSVSQSKITDRVAQNGAPAPGPSDNTETAAVAQRAVLYEEEPPPDTQGKQYVGSVIWKTETVSPGPGQAPELAIRADLEIPDRRMTMTMSLRRNTDKALPASHTIEIMFNLPSDFPFGGISNVPGILMKQAEQTRGAPLAGLAVKVTSGFFLVGLSSTETDMQRNLELLKDRAWFDIPIVYNNGRRAILAVEKGTPGERSFTDAFVAWGE